MHDDLGPHVGDERGDRVRIARIERAVGAGQDVGGDDRVAGRPRAPRERGAEETRSRR